MGRRRLTFYFFRIILQGMKDLAVASKAFEGALFSNCDEGSALGVGLIAAPHNFPSLEYLDGAHQSFPWPMPVILRQSSRPRVVDIAACERIVCLIWASMTGMSSLIENLLISVVFRIQAMDKYKV